MKKLLAVGLIAVVALIWWLHRQRNAPPEVPFARVNRETVVSTVITNGRVEPFEWTAALSQTSGVVDAFHAERGRRVALGDALVEVGAADARAALAAAEARVDQARAELAILMSGGRPEDLAGIESELAQTKLELETAEKDRAALERLASKQAATRQEVEEAARRVQLAQLKLQGLAKRRGALVGPPDRAAAEARVREAESAVEIARRQLEKTVVRASMAGVVYDSPVRLGAFLNTGDTVARIGRTEKVRVRVYVDEPELGRVAKAMPVNITWDALPDRNWQGGVERMPSEISALGTRQVGEVICVIGNPQGELLPGTNVNAEIRSQVAENTLAIPREALRREANVPGVLLLQGDRVVWRKIAMGVTSVTRVQVLEGLAEGDAVALPSDMNLTDGAAVRAVFR